MIVGYNYYNSVTYNIRKIAVVGSDSSISDIFHHFDSKNTTVYRFLEHIDPKLTVADREALIRETMEELKAFCLRESVNEIYLSIALASEELIEEMSHFADTNFIYFRLVTSFDVFGKRSVNVEFLGHIPILGLRKEPLKILLNRMIKRAFDLVFSSLVILIFFPILFPLMAILIKLESKGPVIFKQLRTGKSGKNFWVYKFRTMTINEESDRLQATKGDQRITKVGALMRKLSIDEMPQFFNVLMGQMSVVGPRPHMLIHTAEYSQIIDKYLFRHFITPGITGHAQVHGLRGIDRGLMSEEDLQIIHHKMLVQIEATGGKIDQVYHCSFHPENDHKGWRKPKIGMALEAKKDFPEIDFKRSIMIGDAWSDMQFGRKAGMYTVWISDLEMPPANASLVDLQLASLAAFTQLLP